MPIRSANQPRGTHPLQSARWPLSPWPVITCQDCFHRRRVSQRGSGRVWWAPCSAFIIINPILWQRYNSAHAKSTCAHADICFLLVIKGRTAQQQISVYISSWRKKKFGFSQKINLQAPCVCMRVCACTCESFLLFPIFRKSDGASHCSGPQRMSSYCGFGAPEQLDEFMVSAKKRRGLSSCQSPFPPRSKRRPLWAAKGGRGPQPCI